MGEKQNILISGGCGFIGSHLAAKLHADGHKITIIDNTTDQDRSFGTDIQVLDRDITDEGVFDDVLSDIDVCYHLAAIASVEESRKNWLRCHEINSGGFVRLLEAIKKTERPIPVIYASSAAVYGEGGNDLKESSNATPLSPYGFDKLACEHHGKVAFTMHGIPNIGLRFFNVYGEGQNPNSPYSGVVSKFTDLITKGQDITIFGDGSQNRDFIYIDDVIQSLLIAKEKLISNDIQNDVFNICTGTAIDLVELFATIENISGKTVEKHFKDRRQGDIQSSCGNPVKAKETLGFKANTTIEEGLKRLLSA